MISCIFTFWTIFRIFVTHHVRHWKIMKNAILTQNHDFFPNAQMAKNEKYFSKMAFWASENNFLQNFDIRTYFDTIFGKSNFWRFSIFLKCGFGTFLAKNTVLGAKKHKKVENHIFWYFTFLRLKMARLIRPQSENPLVSMSMTHFGQNPCIYSFTVLVTKKHQKSKIFASTKSSESQLSLE